MESKICTYTEPKHRLQLVRVEEGLSFVFEIRYNRKVVDRYDSSSMLFARMMFSRYVHSILIDRTSPFVLKMTS